MQLGRAGWRPIRWRVGVIHLQQVERRAFQPIQGLLGARGGKGDHLRAHLGAGAGVGCQRLPEGLLQGGVVVARTVGVTQQLQRAGS